MNNKLQIYDMKGAVVGDYELPAELLELRKGDQSVHDVAVATAARRRAGTASTLRKGEVAGSNRKPWRQKGTGRARAGYRQSPVWRGGGVAFGPHPREYGGKVNRKVSRLAFRRVWSQRVTAGQVRLLEELSLPEGKTRDLAGFMKRLNISAPVLFVVPAIERKAALAFRNLQGVQLVAVQDLNTCQLLRYPMVVVEKKAMAALSARLGEKAEGGA